MRSGPVALLAFIVLSIHGAHAQAPRPECVGPLEDRLKLVNQLNDLDKVELPDDKIRDMHAFMAELKDALSGTADDSTKVAEKIEKAADKIQKYLPGAVKPLKDIADGLKKNTKMIGEVMKPVEQFDKALQYVDDLYARTEGGTAKDQVLALQKVFDDTRKMLPVADVPGLKDLFDAYSKGIQGIAESVGNIEKQVDASNRVAHQLWTDDGDPNLEGRDSIYLPNMGLRERLAAKKQALQKKMDAIDKALDAAGCQRPGGPNQPDFSVKADPCFNQKPGSPGHHARVALENAKRRVADIERRIKEFRDKIYPAWDLEQRGRDYVKTLQQKVNGLDKQADDAGKAIEGVKAKIRREQFDQQIAEQQAVYEPERRSQLLDEVARHRANISVLQQHDLTRATSAQQVANAGLADARSQLAQMQKAVDDAHKMQDSARANLAKAQDELGDAIAKVLAQDAAAEKWDAADYKALDDCRERYFDKRVSDRLTPDRVKADMPKPPPTKPAPAPPPAATTCAPPKGGGGGFVGAIEGVNRQMQGNCR